jgi:adenylate cyclase
MNARKFFAELKRRNVYKVAIAYAVIAWLLMQIATQVFPFLEIPNWAIRLVIMLLALGFPVALIIAWAFEATPEGIKRTEAADAAGERSRGGAWIYILLIAAALSVALFFFGRYTASRKQTESPQLPAKSIAVLPFVNMSADKNDEYLSDGISEELITALSKITGLQVKARTSSFAFKGKNEDIQKIGELLHVSHLLEGSVAKAGNRLRISAQLIQASDGNHLWSDTYDRDVQDIFAVRSDVAQQVVHALQVKLGVEATRALAQKPTENLKAFQYYLQGRSYRQRNTREDGFRATGYYERAIEEDGNYALAYAGLSEVQSFLGVFGYIAPIEGRRKAEEVARKALALDDNLAEAHAALGTVYISFVPYNFSLGDRELRRAIELSPSSPMAHFNWGLSLARQGHFNESLAEYLKARELDPLSSIIARQASISYYFKRDYARALGLLRQANELGPAFSTTWEIGIYIQNRLFDETLAELEKTKQERKNDPILIYDTGMIYAAQGKRAEALQVIKELEEISGSSLSQAHWIAKIYATLNEKELAFSWLDRGLSTGAIGAFYNDEPVWDPIRSDPRFTNLLQRMGILQ